MIAVAALTKLDTTIGSRPRAMARFKLVSKNGRRSSVTAIAVAPADVRKARKTEALVVPPRDNAV